MAMFSFAFCRFTRPGMFVMLGRPSRFSVEGSDGDGISVPVDQEDVGKEFVFTVPWAQQF